METTKKRRHPILDKPYLGAILLMIYSTVFYNFIGVLGTPLGETAAHFMAALGGLLVMLIHRAWFRNEFRGAVKTDPFIQKDVGRLVLFFLILDIVSAVWDYTRLGFAAPDLSMLAKVCMAAFGEEACYRLLPMSVMMRALKEKRSYLPALILPAALFSLIHFANIFSGATVGMTFFQVFTALCFGLFFGAVYLRTGNIVIPLILHFVHDLVAFMVATMSTGILVTDANSVTLIESVIFCVILLVITVLMLRGHREEIMETWEERWSA